jgi:hypothetical protein
LTADDVRATETGESESGSGSETMRGPGGRVYFFFPGLDVAAEAAALRALASSACFFLKANSSSVRSSLTFFLALSGFAVPPALPTMIRVLAEVGRGRAVAAAYDVRCVGVLRRVRNRATS